MYIWASDLTDHQSLTRVLFTDCVDITSYFHELLQNDHSFTGHHRKIQSLATEPLIILRHNLPKRTDFLEILLICPKFITIN